MTVEEITSLIREKIDQIDYSKYKDSMTSLIEKDVAELKNCWTDICKSLERGSYFLQY